jgi:two-component system alkaline phosphatase synthesis response regulator PhoP
MICQVQLTRVNFFVMSRKKILVIDDDIDLLELLKFQFESVGFHIEVANNGFDGIKIAKEFMPDIVLLDLVMDKIDGIEVCESMKNIDKLSNTPIAILSGRTESYNEISSFVAGADTYITKPIKFKLLLARINSLLKREYNHSKPNIDLQLKSNILGNNNLTKIENQILTLFLHNANTLLTRDQIMKEVWGNTIISHRTIDVHISNLRKKHTYANILTISGLGYKYVD